MDPSRVSQRSDDKLTSNSCLNTTSFVLSIDQSSKPFFSLYSRSEDCEDTVPVQTKAT
eukprot:CAMPEP_0194052926 /NCGR_PEP_ID=MMETSP0009_2-20130614/47589_1 /TAXON_ID=210454 /ORGANISM="Grammatophora oceanica, Strain CCMP 410" /LENGTH=57 /DNA_ID=CAMNT_0038700761 /DNA_START=30 /DNA_END=199 /DNA_ORIENTATION=-